MAVRPRRRRGIQPLSVPSSSSWARWAYGNSDRLTDREQEGKRAKRISTFLVTDPSERYAAPDPSMVEGERVVSSSSFSSSATASGGSGEASASTSELGSSVFSESAGTERSESFHSARGREEEEGEEELAEKKRKEEQEQEPTGLALTSTSSKSRRRSWRTSALLISSLLVKRKSSNSSQASSNASSFGFLSSSRSRSRKDQYQSVRTEGGTSIPSTAVGKSVVDYLGQGQGQKKKRVQFKQEHRSSVDVNEQKNGRERDGMASPRSRARSRNVSLAASSGSSFSVVLLRFKKYLERSLRDGVEYTKNFIEKPKVDFRGASTRSAGQEDSNAVKNKFKLAARHKLELEAIGSAKFNRQGGGKDKDTDKDKTDSDGNGRQHRRALTIHPQSYFKQYWDTLMTMAVIFACFQAPIRVSFTPTNDLAYMKGKSIEALEILNLTCMFLVEVIFVLDVVVYFFVGYIKLGVVVLDLKLIRMNYMRTTFIWDVLAGLPILFFPVTLFIKTHCRNTIIEDQGSPLGNESEECGIPHAVMRLSLYVTLLQLLKIPSGIRRSMFVRESLSDTWGTTPSDMVMLVVLFIILANFFTCLWFVTMAYNPDTSGFNDWVENGSGNNWLTVQADEGDELVRQAIDCWTDPSDVCTIVDKFVLYINCFYWASNAGDGFDTVQTLEKVTAIFVTIIFNNGFFAFILASIIAGLQDFNRNWKKRAEYRIKIDAVNEFMHSNNVSEVLKNEVRDYFFNVWLPRKVDFTEDSVVKEMPDYIRRKVMRDITIDVILGSKFYEKYFEQFRDKPEWNLIKQWIELTAENVIPQYHIPHQYIVRQGDAGTELFILKSGKVAVLINIEGKEKQVASLGPGAYFGDLSLLGLTDSRSASIFTLSNATVYVLTKEKFNDILKKMPDDGKWIRSVMLNLANSYKR